MDGHHTGCPTVAHLFIIIIHRLIGLEVVQLIAYRMQEVMIKDIRIDTFDDKRTIGGILHLGELFTEFRRQHRGIERHLQTAVLPVDTVQHRLVYRLEHLVGGSLITLLEPFHGGLQRVWCDMSHHADTLQLGRQQMTVVLAFLSLLHDLLQQFVLGLGKILLIGCFHSLPQGSI